MRGIDAGADEAGDYIMACPQGSGGIRSVEGVNVHLAGNIAVLAELDKPFLHGPAVRARGVLGADGDAEFVGLLAFTGGAHVNAEHFFDSGRDAGAGAVANLFEVAEEEMGGAGELDFLFLDSLEDAQDYCNPGLIVQMAGFDES